MLAEDEAMSDKLRVQKASKTSLVLILPDGASAVFRSASSIGDELLDRLSEFPHEVSADPPPSDRGCHAEMWRLIHAARAATGPAITQARYEVEAFFWQHTVEILGPPPTNCGETEPSAVCPECGMQHFGGTPGFDCACRLTSGKQCRGVLISPPARGVSK